ncbi:MAG: transposase, partial [Pirellulaceae bacterium]|nr:transposase [Pirellulaceae bacterium]
MIDRIPSVAAGVEAIAVQWKMKHKPRVQFGRRFVCGRRDAEQQDSHGDQHGRRPTRMIDGEHVYVYLDGIWLKRSWGGEVKNIAVLVAVGVGADGHRQILGVCEGAKEDTESWRSFLRHLKQRGLKGVQMITSDKCLGLVEALGEFYPEAAWQRCTVHFYRNVLKDVPRGKSKDVAAMLKAV